MENKKMSDEKMKAIVSVSYGGPEVLQLQMVNKPIPKDHEVRIKIHAASVTRAETMMRTGYPLLGRLFLGLTKPKNAIRWNRLLMHTDTLTQDTKKGMSFCVHHSEVQIISRRKTIAPLLLR